MEKKEIRRLAKKHRDKYGKIFRLLDAYDKSSETDIRKIKLG